MSNWDFAVVTMALAIIGCSLYGFAKLKYPGCLFMGACWIFALIATLTHPHATAPFCS